MVLMLRRWLVSCGCLLLVDGKVCQTHKWMMALLVMEVLRRKIGILFFRDGLDGIVQRNGGDWNMDGGLFNFNDFILS